MPKSLNLSGVLFAWRIISLLPFLPSISLESTRRSYREPAGTLRQSQGSCWSGLFSPSHEMKRTHPTILNPIHYEHVRYPLDHSNLYFMHLAPDRLLSAVHIRAAASRGILGFSQHISHSLLYQISHIQSLCSTKTCHIYSSYICIPLHIKKKEQHRDAFIRTRVFIFGHKVFKGEANILTALMSSAQADFFEYLFLLYLLERLRNIWDGGKGRR